MSKNAHLNRKPQGANASQRLEALCNSLDDILKELDLQVLELDVTRSSLRVTVEGIDSQSLSTVEEASRRISAAIDEMNLDAVFPGPFELEVSSPGLERPLKTLDHFQRFKGSLVDLKWRVSGEGSKRGRFKVGEVDGETITFEDEAVSQKFQVRLGDIIRAKTVFVWGSEDSKLQDVESISSGKDLIEEVEEHGEE